MPSKEWNIFLDKIEQAREELGFYDEDKKNEECFYRGHSKSTYALSPGLLRDLKTRKITAERWYAEYEFLGIYYEENDEEYEYSDFLLG